MSVLVTCKFHGDTDLFQKAIGDRADEFARHGEAGRAAGAIHHRFGVGDGVVVVVDEWESAEQFEKFFGAPDLQAFVGSVGADPNTQPEITITEAIHSPDEF